MCSSSGQSHSTPPHEGLLVGILISVAVIALLLPLRAEDNEKSKSGHDESSAVSKQPESTQNAPVEPSGEFSELSTACLKAFSSFLTTSGGMPFGPMKPNNSLARMSNLKPYSFKVGTWGNMAMRFSATMASIRTFPDFW